MSEHEIDIRDIAEKTAAAKDIARNKVREIQEITANLRILSLNALIEAKRAGDMGRGFSVVAEEVKTISQNVETLSNALSKELGDEIEELEAATTKMAEQSMGNRLIDLSLNAVELIDRNLYERTCDVRWWATDSAIVDASANPIDEKCEYACQRLGVILNAYTVYLDLWLCDLQGNVIANGRPDQYNVIGKNVADRPWFKHAVSQSSGDDYAVDDIATEYLLNNSQIATYSCGVRENGNSHGKLIGVLGVHFDWQPQAKAIIDGVRLSEREKQIFEVMLVDANHKIIASSGHSIFERLTNFAPGKEICGYHKTSDGRHIAFHKTPGYETYQGLGWYGVIASK
ncbi:methyl-accepting chemotaxis protein [Pseudaquidulcibacter saccharophilus]|uniref:methyl-accepting chemotaxis protein n=1 Tax=Pseudaquidulcibacter saccharophilus TaxID=2831900 RepID=UPI001EFF59D7|nr:methyl-accepting chemotaxis protein [Pseudaquidulcibacter saccharophilus]